MRRSRAGCLFVALVGLLSTAGTSFAADAEAKSDVKAEAKPKGRFDGLKLRSIGPAIGGRVSRVAGVAGDPRVYWAATSQGGVWKSSDGGHKWKSVFDDQPVASIGSIAVAPSDPNVVYVGIGRGEHPRQRHRRATASSSRPTPARAGSRSGSRIGQIGTMAVHPTNPDIAFAAVLGHAFGPNPERGVYRTTDGGTTWQQVLRQGRRDRRLRRGARSFQSARRLRRALAGAAAALGDDERRAGERTLALGRRRRRPGSSSPAAVCPRGSGARSACAVAPSDGRRVYALIEADEGRPLPLRRRRRELEADQRAPRPAPARLVLHDPDRRSAATPTWSGSRRCRCCAPSTAARRSSTSTAPTTATITIVWIDPREPEADDRRQRRRRRHHARRRRELVRAAAADRRSSTTSTPTTAHAVPRGRHDPGPGHGVGPVEQPARRGDHARRLARRRRRRGRRLRLRPVATRRHLRRRVRRHHHRSTTSASDEARNVSIYPTNPSGHGADDLRVRFQWTAPIAVSPHDPDELYHGAQRAVPLARPRPDLGGDLARPDARRQDEAAVVGRPDHRRQHRRRDLRHDLLARRLAASSGARSGRGATTGSCTSPATAEARGRP